MGAGDTEGGPAWVVLQDEEVSDGGEQKQEVPWAEGRRALIRCLSTCQWGGEVAPGVVGGARHVWVGVRLRRALPG